MTSTATAAPATSYQGTDKLLFGLVLAVVTFWLFAGTTGTVAPAIMEDIGPRYIDAASMNLAVSITALFSGLFIVLTGGLADRVGRVKITLIGVALGVVGSLLLVFAVGGLALPLLLAGRAIQGFSAACIMPASMALVKAYWDGPARQRAAPCGRSARGVARAWPLYSAALWHSSSAGGRSSSRPSWSRLSRS
jgi:DHA2 family multidrug resistance protein-like MFS transporter